VAALKIYKVDKKTKKERETKKKKRFITAKLEIHLRHAPTRDGGSAEMIWKPSFVHLKITTFLHALTCVMHAPTMFLILFKCKMINMPFTPVKNNKKTK
jgi:hypothetical protein